MAASPLGPPTYSTSTPKRSRNAIGRAARTAAVGGPFTTTLPSRRAASTSAAQPGRQSALGPAAAGGAPVGAGAGAAGGRAAGAQADTSASASTPASRAPR